MAHLLALVLLRSLLVAVGLAELARVIHPYPTVAEGVMQAGLGFIRKSWAKMPEGGKRKRE